MLKSYFMMALRNFLKHRLFSAINIFGLAVGLTSCLLIMLFVQNELSYDKWIPGGDNIYRVHSIFHSPGRAPSLSVKASPPLRDAILREIPDVEEAARLMSWDPAIRIGEKIYQERVWRAEESFFRIFDLPFLEGDINSALSDNNNIVLSENMALKYFGDTSALDQILNLDGKKDYKVVGIFKNLPENTHLDFDFLVKLDPGEFKDKPLLQSLDYWYGRNSYLYLKLKEGMSPETVADRFPDIVTRNAPPFKNDTGKNALTFSLQNLKYLHSHPFSANGMKTPGDITMVYTVSVIALLILIIASINFMNLSTARATQRSREVSLRKVMGAQRGQLITQFLGEAVVMTMIALILALAMTEIILPWFNEFTGKELALNYFTDPILIVSLIFLVTIMGIISGLYPAFYLSSFRPALVLKANQSNQSSGSNRIRSFLVIMQFSISITMVICTAVVYGQIQYSAKMDRGFSKENKMILRDIPRDNPLAIAQEVTKLPNVEQVSFSSVVPADKGGNATMIDIPGQQGKSLVLVRMTIDHSYLETYNMGLLAGRDFSRDRGQDQLVEPDDINDPVARSSVILNEEAIRKLGYSSPEAAVGQIIKALMWRPRTGTGYKYEVEIIGVVQDINFRSLRDGIRPFVYYNNPTNYSNLTIRYRQGADPRKLVRDVESVWKKFETATSFRHSFLDEHIANQYEDDEKRGTMFAAFAGLAIIIACLGLYGLAAFTAQLRTREIGIRKVMGATVADIIKLLVWQFSKPVLIANIIAWPVAFYVVRDYLNGFQYRIDINPGYFIAASLLTLIIAWVTVTWHAAKVARAKPITALRYE